MMFMFYLMDGDVELGNSFRMLGHVAVIQSDFSRHNIYERQEEIREKCLWNSTRSFHESNARLRSLREVKTFGFEILNHFIWLLGCRLWISTLLFK